MNGEGASMNERTMKYELSDVWEWHAAPFRATDEEIEHAEEVARDFLAQAGMGSEEALDAYGDPADQFLTSLVQTLVLRLPKDMEVFVQTLKDHHPTSS